MSNIIYEVIETPMGTTVIKATLPDGQILSIPMAEGNSDYQAYLNRDKPQVEHLTEIVPASD